MSIITQVFRQWLSLMQGLRNPRGLAIPRVPGQQKRKEDVEEACLLLKSFGPAAHAAHLLTFLGGNWS